MTLDGAKTVNGMNFDNVNTYTLAPGTGGTLTVSGTSLLGQVYRLDKGQYLTNAGQWQNAPAFALNVSDPTLAGPGVPVTLKKVPP